MPPQAQAVLTYDPPTVLKARRYTLRPNTELSFPGGQFPRHRRQVVVTNPGAAKPSLGTNNLQIRSVQTGVNVSESAEQDDGYAVLVFSQQSITLFTNADIVVRNPSDSATVSFMICEIFYA